MQDSATNPYIPQENQQIRAATETMSSPLKRTVKLLMIITLAVAGVIGIGLLFVIPRTSVEDAAARVDLAKALQPPGQLSKLVPVESTLGFSLKYDNQLFTSYAETTPPVDANGKEQTSAYYENDDLRTPRDYVMVRITPSESSASDRAVVADPPQLVVSSLSADDLKANATKPDYKGLSQLALFVQLSTDRRLAAKTADDGTTVSIDASKPNPQTINGVTYQKVRFMTRNENYRIVNVKYDDCYFTIQNDTPYSACVTNIRPNSRSDASLDEQALQSLHYQKPEDQPAADESTDSKGQTTKQSTPKQPVEKDQLSLQTPVPAYNSDFKSLTAIAKNQPNMVRIGTLYCADINLKVASGQVITTLTDACVGNSASGTIVSRDGYIATTGHAIRYNPKAAINGYVNFAQNQKDLADRLDRVLQYLLDAKLILDSDADYLRTGAQIGDQEALAKIENISSIIPDNYITPTKDNYSYAIQPTDKSLVVDSSTGARPSFAYSDTVLQAKYVAANYETDQSLQMDFDSAAPKNDIGLLKVDGSFQNALIGKGSQIKSNDTVTVLGFPTFSDSSLTIAKNQNAPVVTHLKVNQLYKNDSQQMIQTGGPIVPGTDGGGAFDQTGRLVGVSIYGLSYCPDQQCFANGTIRPSDELAALVDDKNMKLDDSSEATKVWDDGVDAYMKSDYASAAAAFTKAGNLYGFNVFAQPLAKLASSKQGSQHDTSLMNQLVGIMIGSLIVLVILTAGFAVVFVLQKRRLDALLVGHYGAAQPTAPTAGFTAPSPQPVAVTPPVPMGQPTMPPPIAQPSYQQPIPQQMPAATPVTPAQPPQPGAAPAYTGQPQPYQNPQPVSPTPVQQPQSPQQAQPQSPPPQAEDPFYRQ